MKLAKIKNKYMFNSNKPEQEHIYLLDYDKHTRSYKAIETTHLYELPKNKSSKLKKGFLKEILFRKLYLPSGVKNQFYTDTLQGNKITLATVDAKVIQDKIPDKQREAVLKFAKEKIKR